jgi:crotonobetainyl-CoA:carnitine CoA-transferase CaiB-like acyl-CoA transferase
VAQLSENRSLDPSHLPLAGIRVLDWTRLLPGPWCSQMLSDLGAEVIKVEHRGVGDVSRHNAPNYKQDSVYFHGVNGGKKSLTIDLTAPKANELTIRLIETSDIMMESFSMSVAGKYGIDAAAALKVNPKLIHCSISGYGQTGPSSQLPGYDAVLQGEAGIMDMTGFQDGAPTRVGVAITDYLAGLYATQGILLALNERHTSGLGQHVDISLFEAMLSVMRLPMSVLLATGAIPSRVGNDHLNIAPYQPLRAKDGLIIVAVANPALWIRFCEAMDRPEWRDDPRFTTNTERVANRAALKEAIEGVFAGLTVDELTARFQAKNVPCGRVRSIGEALEHPQVGPRGILLEQAHPAIGAIQTLAPVVRLSRTPAEVTLPPPGLGEHTEEVLAALPSRVS